MKFLTRLAAGSALLAATATTVLAAGAGAAHAEGNCAGLPSVPVTYVCVVSVTPENAIPTVSQSGGTVTVPSFCYFVGCLPDQNVPTPSITPGTGTVAVITWNNQTYSIPANPLTLALDLPGVPETGQQIQHAIERILLGGGE